MSDSEVLELNVRVGELRRRPGNRQNLRRDVDLAGIAITTARVPDPGRGELEATLESLSDGVAVKGRVSVPWVGECRRCLELTSGVVEAEFNEIFKDRPEADMLPIVEDSIDIGGVVHDASVLSLPLAPLCRDDCPGPLPEMFPVVNGEDAAPADRDPRWAALEELRFDSEPPSR